MTQAKFTHIVANHPDTGEIVEAELYTPTSRVEHGEELFRAWFQASEHGPARWEDAPAWTIFEFKRND